MKKTSVPKKVAKKSSAKPQQKSTAKPITKTKAKSIPKPVSKKTVEKSITKIPIKSEPALSMQSNTKEQDSMNNTKEPSRMYMPLRPVFGEAGIAPLGDRVLVKPLTPEEMGTTTSFGIIIPDTVTKEKSDRGLVIAVGHGRKTDRGERMPLDVEVGDKVLYTKPWNEPVKVDGVEYYLVPESDILAILK